jgi:hypothetical protein
LSQAVAGGKEVQFTKAGVRWKQHNMTTTLQDRANASESKEVDNSPTEAYYADK